MGLNIFKTKTVQKNPIVLTGCKRFSDITFLSNQISTFGMVIVCTGTDHRRRSVEIFVELASSVVLYERCTLVEPVVDVLPAVPERLTIHGIRLQYPTVVPGGYHG